LTHVKIDSSRVPFIYRGQALFMNLFTFTVNMFLLLQMKENSNANNLLNLQNGFYLLT